MKTKSLSRTGLAIAMLVLGTGISPTARAGEAPVLTEEPTRPPYRSWTLGAEAGTTGLGLFGSWRFLDHLGVRGGFDYLQYSEYNVRINDINYDATLRLLSEPLTLDIYPWKKHSFHISVGVQFNQNDFSGTANASGTIIIGGNPFPVASVGTLDLNIQPQLVNPYLSIGGNFFYFDHAHRWAMGGELGVAYTGEPKVSLTRSGPASPLIDAAVAVEQTKIQDYANQYKWWPVAKLVVTYSF